MKLRNHFIALSLLAATAFTAPQTAFAGGADDSATYRQAVETRTAEDPKLVWTASHVALKLKQVAPSVYAYAPDTAHEKNANGYPEATSGGFIVGDNAVLVVDTMLNERLAKQVIGLIRETTNKPIRYIVNTSYHGDHSYGNQYFDEAVEVIQHRKTRDYIRDHFAKDIAFMSQYFGSNQGLDKLKPVAADIVLEDGADLTVDLGNKTVRIRHLGFAQTEGDLFLTTDEGRVVFTGNPIIAGGPALPWLLDGNLNKALTTLETLKGVLDEKAVVVPGHGAPTDMAAIDHHIAYLSELKANVAAQIAAGKSKEEVFKAVTMEDYAGYKLHGWVHAQVNVPAAYKELGGK
jgi:glyoxylase-like metal-dependent hydrolase (beta-lactamase superfamily II)